MNRSYYSANRDGQSTWFYWNECIC